MNLRYRLQEALDFGHQVLRLRRVGYSSAVQHIQQLHRLATPFASAASPAATSAISPVPAASSTLVLLMLHDNAVSRARSATQAIAILAMVASPNAPTCLFLRKNGGLHNSADDDDVYSSVSNFFCSSHRTGSPFRSFARDSRGSSSPAIDASPIPKEKESGESAQST